MRELVESTDPDLPTPAQGWDVRDTVSHLAGTDVEATRALTDPAGFVAGLDRGGEVADLLAGQLSSRRSLTRAELLAQWQSGFTALLEAFTSVTPGTRIPWYGPPMSPASFATARLMEYWAHGQDVADALHVVRQPTARLRHICHLGSITRGFAYVNRGLDPPADPVAVELTAPDGSAWRFGPAEAPDRVQGPAVYFCLLVTQRRHRADTALIATGPAADEWLDLAQCFAGPPGPGRPRLSQPA